MYKLKVKRADQTTLTTYFYNTLQEVADKIAIICNGATLEAIMKAQKEFNFRFYISYSKNY